MESPLDTRALASSPVRRLVGSEFASVIGDFMVVAAMPFAVIAIGGSAKQIGIVLAVQGAGLALALPLGGVAGDWFDRRSVMVAANCVRFVSQSLIAVALVSGAATYWQLIVAQLVHGIATGFYMPASKAIVPDMVPEPAVQPTNGLKVVARSVAGAGGPALGAVAVAVVGPGFAMAADAGSFVVSASLLSGLPARSGWAPNRSSVSRVLRGGWIVRALREAWKALRDGWNEFRGRRWLRSVTIEFALVNALVTAPFYVLAPVVAEESMGGPGAWAIMLTALAAGEFVGGMRAMNWYPKRSLVAAVLVFTLWIVPLFLLAVRAPLPFVVGGVFLAGIGQAGFSVLWETTVQTNVSKTERSRLSSFEQCGSLVLVPVGFLLAGWLQGPIGLSGCLIGGAVFLVAASLVVLALPSVRELRTSGQLVSERSVGGHASVAVRQGLRPVSHLYTEQSGLSKQRNPGTALIR